MSEVAIYHPWIDPDDPGLVKTAALYWDEMQTIVPVSLRDPYRHPWTAEAFREGFLKPRHVSPDCDEVRKTGDEILQDTGREAIRAAVKDCRRTAGLHAEKLPSWVHSDKLPLVLQDALFTKETVRSEGFFQAAEGFISAYMSQLAAAVGESDRSYPLTNHPVNQDVVVDRQADPATAGNLETATSELAQIAFDTVAVHADTPLLTLLRFRDKHRDQLTSFRRKIRQLARQVAVPSTAENRRKLVQQISDDDLQPAVEELEARLRESNVGFVRRVMELALGAGVGWLVSGNLVGPAATGLVGVAFAAWDTRRGRQKLAAGEPLSYLFLARNRFGQAQRGN